MNISRTIIVSVLILAAIISCNPEYTNEEANTPVEKKGTIAINVPLISERFLDFGDTMDSRKAETNGLTVNSGISSSRAYIIANRIEFTLKDSGDIIIGTYTHYPADNGYPAFGEAADTKMNIIVAEGTGYTIEAEVFNTVVSATVPVVTGNSGPFNVVSGQITNVTICCIPYNPGIANENTTYFYTATPTSILFDTNGYEVISTGSEKWYKITPSTYSTIIEAIPDSKNYCIFSIYNSEGSYMNKDSSFNIIPFIPGVKLEFLQATTPDLSYFIGLMPITITDETTCTVDIWYYPGPTDTDEENDNFSTATVLNPNTPVSGLNIDDDYFILSVDDHIGLDIIFTLTILNEPKYSMYLTIYENHEDYIEYEHLEEGENQLLFPINLDSGDDYYLLIETTNHYKGALYTIEWNYL